ncbi:MAG TPA: hypothetical protein K8V56_06135 [Sporosarcina psychrophila]|uniref:Uncharacterized protein n=1 Tax=Sporosarcina psychrophila TaxID=1476 RepID=A0A921FXI5_SPOPS|nr:hypothetical protein [Sporosarcina psychrophila]
MNERHMFILRRFCEKFPVFAKWKMIEGMDPVGSLTMNIALVLIFIFFIASISAVLFSIKNKNIRNKPCRAVLVVIALQLLVFTLFFSNILGILPESVFTIVWWGTVLSGFIFGIKDYKNNSIAATLCLLLSVCLAVLMLLLLGITSM